MSREEEGSDGGLEERLPTDEGQAADRALLRRPGISIRTRLTMGFLAFFLLSAAVTVAAWYMLERLEARIRFLETADRYTLEIQQARRFEKNHFLYGTPLSDVEEHAENAEALLRKSEEEAGRILPRRDFDLMREHLRTYRRLLGELAELERSGGAAGGRRTEIEGELRSHGTQMVAFALELAQKEKANVAATLALFQRLPILFLVLLLLLVVLTANFLARQMLGPLTRLMAATERIARGDFTPIVPARRYRDEFTNLAVALNTMMRELVHRQEVLVQSHKLQAVGTLTAGVAHELNNPLNNIVLTAEMLKEDYHALSDAERLEMVGDLVGQAERAQKIVKNLLDFARQGEIAAERLDLGDLLRHTVNLAGNQLRLKGARIHLEVPPGLPPLHGDRQSLTQVFLNLVLNGVDAVAKGGNVWVEARESPEYAGFVEVRVRDDGHGIPSHVLPHIFDPFFTTKARGKGTGLGLSVSLGIARQHGGDIRAESLPGRGAVFTVLLPASRVPAGGEAPPGRDPEGAVQ
ncbi:MAG: sensor histidine kinase [Acidobacteriota bacterium]